MEITAKELRGKPGQIIEQASRGTEVVITLRGKKMARLVPYRAEVQGKAKAEEEDLIFGIWKDREDINSVEEVVRAMRKRRTF